MKKQTYLFNPIKRLIERWPFLVIMFLFWMLFHLNLETMTIVSGVLVSVGMTWFASYVLYDDQGFRLKTFSILMFFRYLVVLIKEIFLSSIAYIKTVLSGDGVPVVFSMTLDVDDDIKVAVIANSITLTPGTVTLDVVGKTITVLAIVPKGTSIESIQKPIHDQFERLLKKKGV
jgi:multicomponent Na+:H+ antiporter subunit E